MIKKALIFATICVGFSTAYAGDLKCGPKEETAQKTFLGEVKKSQPSIVDQAKTASTEIVTDSKKAKKDCDEHCAEQDHCAEHSKDHDCDETCGHHKHDHQH